MGRLGVSHARLAGRLTRARALDLFWQSKFAGAFMQLPPGGIVNDNAVAESLDSCNALWFASQFHTRCFRRGRALTQPINEGERLLSKVGLVAQPRWIYQDGQHVIDHSAPSVRILMPRAPTA